MIDVCFACLHTGVCVCVRKRTTPGKQQLGRIGLRSTKPGAGEQLLPKDCRAEARVKEVAISYSAWGAALYTGTVRGHEEST